MKIKTIELNLNKIYVYIAFYIYLFSLVYN